MEKAQRGSSSSQAMDAKAEWQAPLPFVGQLATATPFCVSAAFFEETNMLAYLQPTYRGMKYVFDPVKYPVGNGKFTGTNKGWVELKRDIIASGRTMGHDLVANTQGKGNKSCSAMVCKRRKYTKNAKSGHKERDTKDQQKNHPTGKQMPKQACDSQPTDKEHQSAHQASLHLAPTDELAVGVSKASQGSIVDEATGMTFEALFQGAQERLKALRAQSPPCCPFRFNLGVDAFSFFLQCGSGNATHKFHPKCKPVRISENIRPTTEEELWRNMKAACDASAMSRNALCNAVIKRGNAVPASALVREDYSHDKPAKGRCLQCTEDIIDKAIAAAGVDDELSRREVLGVVLGVGKASKKRAAASVSHLSSYQECNPAFQDLLPLAEKNPERIAEISNLLNGLVHKYRTEDSGADCRDNKRKKSKHILQPMDP